MTEDERGTDRSRRRGKRFLSPSQKYEIWLQLVRQEVTIAEAATAQHVDRSTIMRIRTVRRRARWQRWRRPSRVCTAGNATAGQGRGGPALRGAEGDGRQAHASRGKGRWG